MKWKWECLQKDLVYRVYEIKENYEHSTFLTLFYLNPFIKFNYLNCWCVVYSLMIRKYKIVFSAVMCSFLPSCAVRQLLHFSFHCNFIVAELSVLNELISRVVNPQKKAEKSNFALKNNMYSYRGKILALYNIIKIMS